ERTEPAGLNELARGAREPAAAEVLLSTDETAIVRFEAGVDQRFLHDRVAELYRPAGFGLAAVGELFGGERDATDPVATGEPADQHEPVARRSRAVRSEPGFRKEADTSYIDKRIHDVGGVEADAARDRGDADPVAVVSDPRDDTFREISRTFHSGRQVVRTPVEGSEEEGIAERDRLTAHRENIPKDATDAGRGAPVRFDGGGVVVGFDPDRVGVPVLETKDSRVAGAQHAGR